MSKAPAGPYYKDPAAYYRSLDEEQRALLAEAALAAIDAALRADPLMGGPLAERIHPECGAAFSRLIARPA